MKQFKPLNVPNKSLKTKNQVPNIGKLLELTREKKSRIKDKSLSPISPIQRPNYSKTPNLRIKRVSPVPYTLKKSGPSTSLKKKLDLNQRKGSNQSNQTLEGIRSSKRLTFKTEPARPTHSRARTRLQEALDFDKNQQESKNASSKFTSPAATYEKQDELCVTNGSQILYSLSNTHRNNKEYTKEELIEEIKSTSSVTKYHEFKIKLITQDPLLNGIKGSLKKWKVGEILGHGSFGQVLKAFDVDSGEIFALKRIYFNPDNSVQTKFIETLKFEISILKEMSHPSIVRYLGSEVVEDNFCVYLEYLPGGSISRLLSNLGPLPESMVREYIRQILQGLVYLHSNKCIHRDIKGSNILLDAFGNIKLSDFGCSKKYSNSDSESGMVTSMKGSLPWMAPEVLKQTGYGRKADIWSVGCVALEMLTGRPPWPTEDNFMSMLMKIAISPDLPEIPSGISEEAKGFIFSCLQKDPSKRSSARRMLQHSFLN